MPFFGEKIKLRRFDEMRLIDGHESSVYHDFFAVLDVQEEQPDTLTLAEEGSSATSRLMTYGNDALVAEDSTRGVKGDLLFYDGEIYKCTSCNRFGHTLLKHYNSTWTRLPKGGDMQ